MNSPKDYLTDREKLMEEIHFITSSILGVPYTDNAIEKQLKLINEDLLSLITSEVEKERKKIIDRLEMALFYGEDDIEILKNHIKDIKKDMGKALSELSVDK